MAIDTRRIEAAVAEILAAIGEDVTRPGLLATPKRVAAAYAEFFSGLAVDPLSHLAEAVDLEAGELGEVVIVRDIRFRSVCEHHLLPFIGTAHVAYVPDQKVVGLGSLAHVVETLADRPQLQERLGEEIADAIQTGLAPLGVLVVLDAAHQCVTMRGPRQGSSSTVTLASRGTLSETSSRAEIISLIGGGIRE
ncbi:GTP cyclohydrolase I FolE [Conyzicola sp.]|uniref:GTP cyclohydrolase I FolE n=1 Tax=Conyzicola sp. TaxID=1969404 RepID=UPI0039891E1C